MNSIFGFLYIQYQHFIKNETKTKMISFSNQVFLKTFLSNLVFNLLHKIERNQKKINKKKKKDICSELISSCQYLMFSYFSHLSYQVVSRLYTQILFKQN